MLTEKDICILIPTYNRADDVTRLVSSLVKDGKPARIILLDQSTNEKTKIAIGGISKNYSFVKYKYYKTKGKNIVLNYALDEVKKGYKLIFLIDDDVEVLRSFFKNVLNEFNSNKKTKIVGAVDVNDLKRFKDYNFNSFKSGTTNGLLKFFLLPYKKDHGFKILGPYGNTMSPKIFRDMRDCQWIPGFVMCCRNEVFENYRVPDRIGYDVSEDIDLSYCTYLRNGDGSLVIPKNVRVKHNYSQVERYADKKRIFVNHEDHFNFYFRYFDNFDGTVKFIWEIFWINILNILRTVFIPKKINFLKLIYFWEALAYCIKNRRRIKAGKSRMFLNPDLSMKKDYA